MGLKFRRFLISNLAAVMVMVSPISAVAEELGEGNETGVG